MWRSSAAGGGGLLDQGQVRITAGEVPQAQIQEFVVMAESGSSCVVIFVFRNFEIEQKKKINGVIYRNFWVPFGESISNLYMDSSLIWKVFRKKILNVFQKFWQLSLQSDLCCVFVWFSSLKETCCKNRLYEGVNFSIWISNCLPFDNLLFSFHYFDCFYGFLFLDVILLIHSFLTFF